MGLGRMGIMDRYPQLSRVELGMIVDRLIDENVALREELAILREAYSLDSDNSVA